MCKQQGDDRGFFATHFCIYFGFYVHIFCLAQGFATTMHLRATPLGHSTHEHFYNFMKMHHFNTPPTKLSNACAPTLAHATQEISPFT